MAKVATGTAGMGYSTGRFSPDVDVVIIGEEGHAADSGELFIVPPSIGLSNTLLWSWRGYFDSANELKPLLHTWSLGVEEQFYLMLPIIFLFAPRRILFHILVALYAYTIFLIAN